MTTIRHALCAGGRSRRVTSHWLRAGLEPGTGFAPGATLVPRMEILRQIPADDSY
jgi:hypothetical protein